MFFFDKILDIHETVIKSISVEFPNLLILEVKNFYKNLCILMFQQD